MYGHDKDLSADSDYQKGRIDSRESYYIVYSTPQYGERVSSPQSVLT